MNAWRSKLRLWPVAGTHSDVLVSWCLFILLRRYFVHFSSYKEDIMGKLALRLTGTRSSAASPQAPSCEWGQAQDFRPWPTLLVQI